MNTEEIIQNHYYNKNSIEALIFRPTRTPTKIVVSFSGMESNKFQKWSWFYEQYTKNDDTVYVALRDEAHLFYLPRNNEATHKRHINFINEIATEYNLTAKNMYFVGSSMGGYAAIYYGFLMNVSGIIVTNPLVDLNSARRHMYRNWEKQMLATGPEWQDLDLFVYTTYTKPKVFIQHGMYAADKFAAEKLINSFNDLRVEYTRSFTEGVEHSDVRLSKNTLFSIIELWERIKND